jgi:glycosyltransferase involved in cell wall biosynthesis
MPINLLVNATALNSRGGLTVVKQFITEVEDYLRKTDEFALTIMVSVKDFMHHNHRNLNIIYNDSPKKGFVQKYLFEKKEIPKIIKNHNINCYFSLANTFLFKSDLPQYVLIHNPLPFDRLKWSEIDIPSYLKYKVMLNLIYKTRLSKKVNGIIVQTQWMKNAIVSKYDYKGHVQVIRPSVSSNSATERLVPLNLHLNDDDNGYLKFIYPTSVDKYKNTRRLIQAVERYNQVSAQKVILFLTLEGQSTELVKYIGKIPYESMYWVYRQMDALIFPSLTETLGLPLQEALDNDLHVLAADLPYAREVCGLHADYFNPRSVEDIADGIGKYVRKKNKIKRPSRKYGDMNHSYIDFLDFIKECELGKGEGSPHRRSVASQGTF